MSAGVDQNPPDEERDILDRHVNQLMEHFDTVQIFVTKSDGPNDRTRGRNRAGGNWFARYGQVREWITFEEEQIRASARPNREDA